MNHFAQFDPQLIRERNAELGREVRRLHLEKRLRQGGTPVFGRRLLTLFTGGTFPRRTGLEI